MALLKQTTIPGLNIPVSYFRVERIHRIDELAKEAVFRLHCYTDQTHAKTSTTGGFYHGGSITVRNVVFDAYFSRNALHQTKNSVHGQVYQLIKDVIAAKAATAPTDLQRQLASYGQVDIDNDFGGTDFFKDAIDVFEEGQQSS